MKKRMMLWGLLFWLMIPIGWIGTYAEAAETPNIQPINRTTVNGMTVLLQKSESPVVSFTLLLKSGSGLDPVNRKGTAEIMNSLVYLKLSNTQDKLSQVNLMTYPDYTLITIKSSPGDVDTVLKEIKELLSYPLYEYDIISDLKKLYSTDLKAIPGYARAYYELGKEFYGVNHPYNDLMNPETMLSITGHDVYRWYRQTYQPGNAILSISGGIGQDIKYIEKFFANMLSEKVDRSLMIQPVIPEQTKQMELEDPNGRIASIGFAYAAPRLQDPEYPAFRILTYYLEEYQHYFDELRVKSGLIYAGFVMYNYLEKPKAPNIIFLTMTSPEKLNKVESKTTEVVNQLINRGIDQAIIEKVVKAIKTEAEAAKKAGNGIATRNALSYYLQNQIIYDENLWPKLEKVKTDDIKAAAAKYLKNYVRVSYIPKEIAENF